MNTVFMEGTSDCAAACLAMALGFKRASQIYPLLGYNPSSVSPPGTSDAEVTAVLHNMRRAYHWCIPREQTAEQLGLDPAEQKFRSAMPTKKQVTDRLGSMLTGCAIVAVPSLVDPEVSHFVFCKKGEVYDPTPSGLKYNGTASSLPVQAAIFLED